eukprot:jgi/Psemu1/320110/estExt_fgenesh1_pm.C_4060005
MFMLRRLPKTTTGFRVFASLSPWKPKACARHKLSASAQSVGCDPRFSGSGNRTEEFLDVTARGVGQVIFLNSPKSGQILGLGLVIGDPYLAVLAALGTVTATATANAAGLDKASIQDGLMSYNGCLVGCASAVFGPPSIIAATTATIVGASATPFVAASLKEAMGGVPQWTFAFNFVTLTSLLRTRPLLPSEVAIDEKTGAAAEVATSAGSSGGSLLADVIASPLTGISQIFVVQSALSGAIILGGIGSYSPMLAVHALGGSTMGTLVGAMSGAPLEELTMGLWGFNSCLTSMAVGVFFVHSTPTMLLSAGGAAATASLFGAMKTLFGAYGSPCLTLPFCFTMSAGYLLQKQVPTLMLANSPHSPEKNKK